MKKIGTITFHSPYNYGSSLQAYALQETVKKICNQDCEYKIINLRTEKQKYMYEIDNEKSYINKLIKRVLLKDYKEKYKIKNQKFEDFINNKLNVTREYKTYDELEKEGYIKSVQGKGSFVAPKNSELVQEKKRKEIQNYIEKIIKLAQMSDISEKEIIELFKLMYKGEI